MTHTEVKLFIKKIKFIYPRFMQDTEISSKKEFEEYINLWQELLSDLSFEVCAIALKRHVMISKWEPSIADIRDQAAKIENKDMSAADSWNKCFKLAVRLPNYPGAIWNLDDYGLEDIEIKCLKAVGVEQIKLSECIGVERSNFIRYFEELNSKRIIENKMPQSLKLRQPKQNLLTCNDNNTDNDIKSIGESIEETFEIYKTTGINAENSIQKIKNLFHKDGGLTNEF